MRVKNVFPHSPSTHRQFFRESHTYSVLLTEDGFDLVQEDGSPLFI